MRAFAALLALGLGSPLVAPPPELPGQAIRVQATARATSRQLHNLAVVAAAAMDRHRRVYIVDPMAPGIVIAGPDLRRLGFYGRRGSGPGEFREPASIGVLADGRVAVLDRALGRVIVFAVAEGGASLLPRQTLNLEMSSEAMCVLPGDRLLIYGFSGGSRLHVFDLRGRRLRSFAPPTAARSPMALDLLTRGNVACDSERDQVVVSSRMQPYVETYRISTGELAWAGVLSPFRGIQVRDQGSRVTISSGPAGASLVTGLLSTGDYLLFQTVYDARTDGVQADTIVTYVYSTRTGQWLPRGTRVPLLFGLGRGTALSVSGRDQVEMVLRLNRVTTASYAATPPRRSPR